MKRQISLLFLLIITGCTAPPNGGDGEGGDGSSTYSSPGAGVQPRLNDTGVTEYLSEANDGTTPIRQATAAPGWEGQDAEFGRDATASLDSDGRAGFRFTKLTGPDRTPVDPTADYTTTPWDCVRDEVTGLVWEVKTRDANDPRFHGNTFSWYDPDPTTNGGYAGIPDDGDCQGLDACDTAAYVDHLNDIALCGFTDWRLPTVPELLSLVDYGATQEPLIDTRFFPNTQPSDHWTSQTEAGTECKVYQYNPDTEKYDLLDIIPNGNAWEVHFDKGHTETHCKFDNRDTGAVRIYVRLVRGPN